jgi:hypothetical protein
MCTCSHARAVRACVHVPFSDSSNKATASFARCKRASSSWYSFTFARYSSISCSYAFSCTLYRMFGTVRFVRLQNLSLLGFEDGLTRCLNFLDLVGALSPASSGIQCLNKLTTICIMSGHKSRMMLKSGRYDKGVEPLIPCCARG